MLTELHIENLGVIERLELVLGDGLTALTGETGAGKTMLVEAIELLVGGRADASIVRPGATEARVDGRFVLAGRPGDDADDGDEVVLTRVIPAEGRSRAYVNGRLATVAALAEATSGTVDLHGQHAHQSLLAPATQRAALDSFGDVDLEPLRRARARLTEIDAELATLGGDERSRARELDLLRFQIDELAAAAIEDADEQTRLAHEEAVLADAVAHRQAGAAALELLTADGAARDALGTALAGLGEREPFRAEIERLVALVTELDDLTTTLRDVTESVEEDPERLQVLRERRQLLRDLCRKYGDDLGEVLEFQEHAARRLAELEAFDERAAALDRDRTAALDDERRAAARVGERRRAVAPVLAAAVEERLRELAMPNASIAIDIAPPDVDAPGERVQFLLAANPGAPLLPLNRVASGGELARAMLALRLVLSHHDTADAAAATLVFDEVDAGIGGAAAVAVGAALESLARRHQVLVVTHLPQVAAAADAHVVVSKAVRDGATYASAERVDGDDRAAEIARMLAGRDSETARRHARELLGGR